MNNVGYSLFNSKKKTKVRAWRWGVWKLQGLNFCMKCMDLIEHIQEDIGPFDILVTEWPAFFSSERGNIAAHQNYTIDLAGIAMFTAGWFQLDHRRHFPITAMTWKGTVRKDVTAQKFFRHFGKKSTIVSEHAVDASMLNQYFLTTYGEQLCRRYEEDWERVKLKV